MPAPKGNQYGKRAARWRHALERALARVGDPDNDLETEHAIRRGLDKIADTVVQNAAQGDDKCWMEIANRLDGKVTQPLEIGEDPDNPLPRQVVITIARPENNHFIDGEYTEGGDTAEAAAALRGPAPA